MIHRLLALALLVASTAFAAEYRFTLEGEDFDPGVLPVEGTRKGAPAPGDIGRVAGFLITLREPGHYQFTLGGKEQSKLFARIEEGPLQCVGVKIRRESKDVVEDSKAPLINPLLHLTDAERARLWTVQVEAQPNEWRKILDGVNWEHTALEISCDGDENAPLPDLPAQLRYFSFDCRKTDKPPTFSQFKNLTELRYLSLTLAGQPIDCAHLRECTKLRNLNLESATLSNTIKLSNLSDLRFLKLRKNKGLDEIEFVTGMPHLRVFKIDGSDVSDLSFLSDCPELRLLSVTGSKADTLPDADRLRHLRDVRLLSTPLSSQAEAIAQFRAAVPHAVVHSSWEGALRHKLTGVTRLRIRSGGTCHRDLDTEKTLLDLRDSARIEKLTKAISIADEDSGSNCLCCGDPSLEFYQDDNLILTLGFHHAQSLRWPSGLWPGDAILTPKSAKMFCELLAEHGVDQPFQEWKGRQQRELTAERHQAAIQKHAPLHWLQVANKIRARDFDSLAVPESDLALPTFEEHAANQWPDRKERARRLFAMFGILPDVAWNDFQAIDWLLVDALGTYVDEVTDLIANHPDDGEIREGIARLWSMNPNQGMAPEIQELNLAWALAHPVAYNRVRAIYVLAAKSGEETLLKFLKNPPARRQVTPNQQSDSADTAFFSLLEYESLRAIQATDREIAALLLAERGALAAGPVIEEILASTPEEERKYYQQALDILGQKTPK